MVTVCSMEYIKRLSG